MHSSPRSLPAFLVSAVLGLVLGVTLLAGAAPSHAAPSAAPTSAGAATQATSAKAAHHRYVLRTAVWSRRHRAHVRLVVREVRNGRIVARHVKVVRVTRGRTPVRMQMRSVSAVNRLRVGLVVPAGRRSSRFWLGRVHWQRVVVPTTPVVEPPVEEPPVEEPPVGEPQAGTLSNGCGYSVRGLPSCGAYLGQAYGSNTDPTALEQENGRRLGVRRTYFTSTQVDKAVRMATTDLAAGRLPWVSFKLPHSWTAMANGQGDAWARDLTAKFDALDGPVWLAFHHEPENDGDITEWTRMQERLGPIVRSADNVAFTVVVTGWHQFYGDAQFRLANMWPDTRVDVAGFDVYNALGVVKNGKENTKGTDLNSAYFAKIAAWARTEGVAWGLAETGISHKGAVQEPQWIRTTYRQLDAAGGVAFAYFNTWLNSVAPWELSTAEKRADWLAAQNGSPLLPRR